MLDVIDYLRAQPEDFVLSWYTDSMNSEKPWDSAWIDVLVDDKLAWVITSGLLEDDGDEFIWPPDMVGLCLIDPDRAAADTLAGIMPVSILRPPTEDEITEIRWAASRVGPNSYWMGTPCWSAQEINRAIEDQLMRTTGRPIQARWDADHGPSPHMQHVLEMAEAIKDGVEPKYLIRPGLAEGGEGVSVYASDEVMDMLMRLMLHEDDE